MSLTKFIAGAVAALGLCAFTAPAFANSASNADIAAPLRAAEASRASNEFNGGDEQFRNLFASWESLDNGRPANAIVTAPRSGAVSIPSIMPIDTVRFSSGFGMRVHPVLGGLREHKGMDLAAPTGTPIHAAADGTVAMAQRFGAYGLFVELEHGGALETRYGHMSRIAVAEGQQVHKGDVIGYVGATGRATGPHLHYEVRVNGVAVNPMPYMEGTGTTSTQLASR